MKTGTNHQHLMKGILRIASVQLGTTSSKQQSLQQQVHYFNSKSRYLNVLKHSFNFLQVSLVKLIGCQLLKCQWAAHQDWNISLLLIKYLYNNRLSFWKVNILAEQVVYTAVPSFVVMCSLSSALKLLLDLKPTTSTRFATPWANRCTLLLKVCAEYT